MVDRNGLTTYFRHTFNAANTAQSLDLSVLRDDGVVVYLNGTEIWRNNMPTGTITNTTRHPARSPARPRTVHHCRWATSWWPV